MLLSVQEHLQIEDPFYWPCIYGSHILGLLTRVKAYSVGQVIVWPSGASHSCCLLSAPGCPWGDGRGDRFRTGQNWWPLVCVCLFECFGTAADTM